MALRWVTKSPQGWPCPESQVPLITLLEGVWREVESHPLCTTKTSWLGSSNLEATAGPSDDLTQPDSPIPSVPAEADARPQLPDGSEAPQAVR